MNTERSGPSSESLESCLLRCLRGVDWGAGGGSVRDKKGSKSPVPKPLAAVPVPVEGCVPVPSDQGEPPRK